MATPVQPTYDYEVHTNDGNIHNVSVTEHHDHHHGGDVSKWFNKQLHNKYVRGFLITGASVLLIKYGNKTIWKKS